MLTPFRDMRGRLAIPQFLCLIVVGVVVFVHLQYLIPAGNDQRPVHWQAQHLIHRQQFTFANTTGLAELRRIVADTPCTQLFGLAGY